MNIFGIKDTQYFNKRTGAIVVCQTDGLEIGEEWINMTDNPGWKPLFTISGEYVGYTKDLLNGLTFVFKEHEFPDEDQ